MNVLCPVCDSQSHSLELYSRDRIAQGLSSVIGRAIDLPTDVGEYELRRCVCCELEFSNPMSEPGRAFYEFLSRADVNYPPERWEWQFSASRLATTAESTQQQLVVVDVGCGDGKFLEMLDQQQGVVGLGIDLNPGSVEACRRRGLTVLQGTLESVYQRLPSTVSAFTFWHVVEHVGSPIELLKLARARLASDGMILFSVPLTPMSYEHSWPDPLNAPPHHLTRWSMASLQALAERLEMSLQVALPDAETLLLRVSRSLVLQAVPPFSRASRFIKAAKTVGLIARRPWLLPMEVWRQMTLPRINGRVRPDVALACLTPR